APLEERIAAANKLANHPRIVVTGLEAAIGARYTFDTVRYLKAHCPGVEFVWIMGADNLRSFHRWENWRGIAALVPIAVVDRPGPRLPPPGGRGGRAPPPLPPPATAPPPPPGPAPAGLGLPAGTEVAPPPPRAARGRAAVKKPPLKMSKIEALRNGLVV